MTRRESVELEVAGRTFEWHVGASCEAELRWAIDHNLDPSGHLEPPPRWLVETWRWSANLGWLYHRYLAPVICWVLGHDMEVWEGGSAESGPRVDWACVRCGEGGHAWR